MHGGRGQQRVVLDALLRVVTAELGMEGLQHREVPRHNLMVHVSMHKHAHTHVYTLSCKPEGVYSELVPRNTTRNAAEYITITSSKWLPYIQDKHLGNMTS